MNKRVITVTWIMVLTFMFACLCGVAAAEGDQARWESTKASGVGSLVDAVIAANKTADTTITLLKDIGEADFPEDISDNEKKLPFTFTGTNTILDLNGHTIDRGLTSAIDYGNVITVAAGATLTLKDGRGDGVITGGYNNFNTGGGVCVEGTFILQSGSISGNTTRGGGGGVFVYTGATFTMEGGSITLNNAVNGGGVHVFNGTFTMVDGTIRQNTVTDAGGGVAVFKGSEHTGNSIFNMEGGAVDENETIGKHGGGVCINAGCTLNLSGAPTITDNINGNLCQPAAWKAASRPFGARLAALAFPPPCSKGRSSCSRSPKFPAT